MTPLQYFFSINGTLFPKLLWPISMRKKCSCNWETFWNLRLKAKNLQSNLEAYFLVLISSEKRIELFFDFNPFLISALASKMARIKKIKTLHYITYQLGGIHITQSAQAPLFFDLTLDKSLGQKFSDLWYIRTMRKNNRNFKNLHALCLHCTVSFSKMNLVGFLVW